MEYNPRLIEPGAKNYMTNLLSKCHDNRVSIYLYILNVGTLVIFIGIVALILYYCHKNKITPTEEAYKMQKEQQYILSKIRYYKDHQHSINSKASITGLPTTDLRPV
tara:strand:+ start:6241 stop:6561 length:321 start_codon:yes stop_codon:yes gene_type:complete